MSKEVEIEVILNHSLMDSFAFWNIRGLNEPCKQFAIKSLISKNKACFISILESRIKEANKSRLLDAFLNWHTIDNYDATDGGRMWVLWDPRRVIATSLKVTNQMIHCSVVLLDSNT